MRNRAQLAASGEAEIPQLGEDVGEMKGAEAIQCIVCLPVGGPSVGRLGVVSQESV